LILVLLAGVVALAAMVEGQCGCPAEFRNKRAVLEEGTKQTIIGDMVLTGAARDFFFADNATASKFRAMSNYGPHKWTGNRLNYLIGGDVAASAEVIRRALRELQAKIGNCVTFNELKAPAGDYVHVFNGGNGACFSNIGRVGGMQKLSLGSGCTNSLGTIQHEFMHALGFFHEQSRPDRDNYIRIDFDRTTTYYCGNYMKCRACYTHTPYNIKSVMHYPSHGFGCGGVPTIFTVRGEQIPYNHEVQPTDVQNIKQLYGCR